MRGSKICVLGLHPDRLNAPETSPSLSTPQYGTSWYKQRADVVGQLVSRSLTSKLRLGCGLTWSTTSLPTMGAAFCLMSFSNPVARTITSASRVVPLANSSPVRV
jgi:hypothetical protein